MNITYVADQYAVSPQIQTTDIDALKESGFVAIVCNRPDGEDSGQPTAAEISAQANAQGLSFIHLPMNGPMMSVEQLDDLDAFLNANPGKVFSYCRSGNRSNIMYQALLEKKAAE